MTQTSPDPVTTAEAFLARLGAHGVDYLFGNAGTDFPSIIEGFCRAREDNHPVPTPIAVPHENLAVAMAHGYYHATGRLAPGSDAARQSGHRERYLRPLQRVPR